MEDITIKPDAIYRSMEQESKVSEHRLILTKKNRLASVEGRQTQIRRVMNPQPDYIDELPAMALPGETTIVENELWRCSKYSNNQPDSIKWRKQKTPYQVGDLLYMCEPVRLGTTWAPRASVEYIDDGITLPKTLLVEEWEKFGKRKYPQRHLNITSACFMYKSLARHWFEVTQVRCERLQDISLGDAVAEGFPSIGEFNSCWNDINFKRGHSWQSNPWVWAYTYRKIKRPA